MITTIQLAITVALLVAQVTNNSSQIPLSDIDKLQCISENNNKAYKIKDKIGICLQIIPLNQKISYQIEVDQYTAIKMTGIFKHVKSKVPADIPDKEAYLMVQSSWGSKRTYPALYYKEEAIPSNTKVFPIYSVIIRMENGIVKDLQWDNGCFGCSGDMCPQLQNYLNSKDKYNICRITGCNNDQNADKCDPQIYVSFIGTDVNGDFLVSAGSRFSRYQKFSIGEMYQSALNLKY